MWGAVKTKLLISDANILIDMDAGEILETMFQLNYEFATPDILYSEELEEQHPYLIKMGLQTLSLSGESVLRVVDLKQRYDATGVSSNDFFTLALAEQVDAPVLTGDHGLKQVCIEENKEVHGTLWVVEKMVGETLITIDQAELAYKKMIDDGSRLPQDMISAQLQRFRENVE